MKQASCFVLAAAVAATAMADTYPRQPGFDAIHYRFRLSLRDETDEIEGEAAITLEFRDAETQAFVLDLNARAGDRGMSVSEVVSDGTPLQHTHEGGRLSVTLREPPRSGDRRTFVVRYRGVPAEGLRIGANRQGERSFFSNNWPDKARHWLPVIDHPYDKATSEFLVEAPAAYQVVSNGVLVEETDLGEGRRLTHWKQSVPIPTWLNALAVAPFASHHAGTVRGVPLQSWVNPKDRASGRLAFEGPAQRVLDHFSERIGPFPFEKLGCIQAAGTNGGMEHASAIFFGENAVDHGPADRLVAHEVAHQWFGDSLTVQDWDEIWLSEGFATYFTLLFVEHDKGRDAFVRDLRQSRARVLRAESRRPDLTVRHHGLSDTRQILNDLVYQKGAWVLHMLRSQIGDDAFTAGIRTYYRTYRDTNVRTDDFRRVMEQASGSDLSGFFSQWLDRPGHPVLKATWHFDSDAKTLALELTQTQAGEPYRIPLDVRVMAGPDSIYSARHDMKQARQTWTFAVDREPSEVVLDPDCWLLIENEVAKAP